MIKEGEKVPNFIGKDQSGNTIQSADLLGKRYAIYFYPKDNTPGCTTQACNLRDNYDELKKKEILIFGVSMDNENSHQKFIDKFSLPFPLIADIDKSVIESFGVWGPKKFMGKEYDGIHRTTFLIDEKGFVKSVIQKPDTKNHAKEIIEKFENK
jgi:thioredoxin-dependent peroxiredoxin